MGEKSLANNSRYSAPSRDEADFTSSDREFRMILVMASPSTQSRSEIVTPFPFIQRNDDGTPLLRYNVIDEWIVKDPKHHWPDGRFVGKSIRITQGPLER